MIPFHGGKGKPEAKQTQANQKKHKTQNQTKAQNTTKNKTSRSGMAYPNAAMKRSDQAAYVPRPEQVILEATAESQTLTRWPGGAKQKSRSAETRDPPSQDPGDRITKPYRHNKHQCTSIASICQAVWKTWRWNEGETKVKRKWDIQSEKKTAATSKGLSESSHVCFGDHHSHTQSPDCWRSVPHTEGQLGTLSLRYCSNLGCSPYVTKLNK